MIENPEDNPDPQGMKGAGMHLGWCSAVVCVFLTASCNRGIASEAFSSNPMRRSPRTIEKAHATSSAMASTGSSGRAALPAQGKNAVSPSADATRSGEGTPTVSDNGATLGHPFLLKRAGIRVVSLMLARGIEKTEDRQRLPIAPGYIFVRDERPVYVVMDLENENEVAGEELRVGWVRPGKTDEGNAVTVSVASSKSWRTWAFNKYVKTALGIWQVVVRDSNNAVLARALFEMRE